MITIYKSNQLTKEAKNLRIAVFCDEQQIDIKEEITGDDHLFTHYYLYVNESLVSYARGRKIDDYYLIGRVITKKEERRKGYSSKLLSYIEKDAIKENIKYLLVHAQEESICFYEKLGFIITSPRYIEAGINHYNMEKRISKKC